MMDYAKKDTSERVPVAEQILISIIFIGVVGMSLALYVVAIA